MNDQHVLVVEHDPAVRALIAELLTDDGYMVLLATHGMGGLHLAERCQPSVVVVNHVLPDMSGLDVLEKLRQRPSTRSIPVVLVSARIQQLSTDGMGADRVLPIPFDIDVLLTHVHQLATPADGAVA
jgi:DNA-binding response OmpR family regulator